MKTFSANGIAEMWEVDRQTVQRTMRSVPADAKEKGQRRWKMSTALAARDRHNRSTGGGNVSMYSGGSGVDPMLARLFRNYDAAVAAMEQLPDLEQRRAVSIKELAPQIAHIDAELRRHGKAVGVDDELQAFRADRLFQLTIVGYQRPCQWTREEAFEHMDVTCADAPVA